MKLIYMKNDIETIMQNEKLLTFDKIVTIEMLKIGYRLSQGTLPKNLASNLNNDHKNQSLHRTHNYNTCNKNTLRLPNARKRNTSRQFSVQKYPYSTRIRAWLHKGFQSFTRRIRLILESLHSPWMPSVTI